MLIISDHDVDIDSNIPRNRSNHLRYADNPPPPTPENNLVYLHDNERFSLFRLYYYTHPHSHHHPHRP